MIKINTLDVNALHFVYNEVLGEISNRFNSRSNIFSVLTGDELSPDGFVPNLREAYYGCTNENWCIMDNNVECYPNFSPISTDVNPPSLIGYADVGRYTGEMEQTFTFFGYIPLTYKLNFYDDDQKPGIKISQYDELIDTKTLEDVAYDVLVNISKRVLKPSTQEELLISRIFGHPNVPIFNDDTLYHKKYVLCNGDLVLIPICGIRGDYVVCSYTNEGQCIDDMNTEIMGGIMALVDAFDAGMSEWYANYNSGVNFNGYQYVDLGLPSGTVWSIGNIDECDDPTQIGLDYMWGFTDSTKYCNEDEYAIKYDLFPYNHYNQDYYILDDEDDIAHRFMGGDWTMPTSEDVQELLEHTKVEFYDEKDETLVLMSNINGRTIQFTGFGYTLEDKMYDKSFVHFWTKEHSRNEEGKAICAKISDGGWDIVDTKRYYGMHCRGVVHTK